MRWKNKTAAALVGVLLCGMTMDCAAKTNDEIQEVSDFVISYYEAQTPEGIETLAEYVADPENVEFQIELMRLRATFRHGIKGMDNFETIVCPMSDGRHWIVAVSSDLLVEGIDVGLPGLRTVLVGRNEDDELKIMQYMQYEELSKTMEEEIWELSLSDEIIDQNTKIATAYNALLVENPDILEWASETSEAIEKEVAEMVAEGKPDDSYIVKQGDCLWDIAKEQLGDGMLWSDIYETNRSVIGEDPDLLYVGIELKLEY